MILTRHGKKRMKDRLGASKRSSDRIAEKALSLGITHAELTGSLCRYVDSIYLKKRTANNIRIYAQKIFLFRNDLLITVLPLPPKYFSCIEDLKQKKKTS